MSGRIRCTLASVTAFAALAWLAPCAQAQAKSQFDLPAQPLADSLRAVGSQANLNILIDPPLVAGRQAPALKAEVTADEALTRLLVGTGLKPEHLNETTIVLALANTASMRIENEGQTKRESDGSSARSAEGKGLTGAPPSGGSSKEGQKSGREGLRVVPSSETKDTGEVGGTEKKAVDLDEIVVTGSHIRGIQDAASPLVTVTAQDVERSGVSTASELARMLPQNFGGGQSDLTSSIGYSGSTNNFTQGGAFNLRGLGNDSTLVLLNGRRISAAGVGDFVDISAIPVAAIDHMDVLTDGASAIYGADAVGGVVNFVMRKRYDGAETRLRYGGATSGGGDQVQAGQLFGHTWDSGSVLLDYDYAHDANVGVGSRSFSAAELAPADLLPERIRHSVLGSFRQDVTENVEVFADGLYSHRSDATILSISGPPDILGDQRNIRAEQYNATLGTATRWADDWRAELAVTRSRNDSTSDEFFPVDGPQPQLSFSSNSGVWTIDPTADGPIFSLPGGAVRIAVGGQFRFESYESDAAQASTSGKLDRRVYAGYGELFIPLVGSSNSMALVKRLEMTAAVRYEHYSDFGPTTNPKIGLVWSPVNALSISGTYGTSFRAPLLSELSDHNLRVFPYPFSDVSGPTPTIYVSGGNPQLKPERASTWTAGMKYNPPSAPDFSASLNYFGIRFKDLISTPIPGAQASSVLINPGPYGSFVTRNPSASLVNGLYASPGLLNPLGITADQILAIINNQTVNVAALHEEGIDAVLGYTLNSSVGVFSMSLAGTYLLSLQEQPVESGESEVALANTLYNPLRLKMRGSLGWQRGGFTASAFINYSNSYTNSEAVPAQSISSWTTIDATLQYETPQSPEKSWLQNLKLSIGALNVMNKNPPYVATTNENLVNFDPANASPLGRFAFLQVSKAW